MADQRSTPLVTGASGQLGAAFRHLLPEATFLDRRDLDLSSPDTIRGVVEELSPSVVINCAAYTAVDRAEDEENLATIVNGIAVGELAAVTDAFDVPFVTYSTDYVFDGDAPGGYAESDEPSPINAYGRSKRVGEQAALEYRRSLVIRTSWVISPNHDNFVATMLRLASAGRSLRVVDDQRGRPTIASDLAAATLDALEAGATGLLHLSNPPPTTWFGLAKAAVHAAGLDPEIRPCASSEFPTPARRPANSILVSERLEPLGIDDLPGWQDGLLSLVDAQMARLNA